MKGTSIDRTEIDSIRRRLEEAENAGQPDAIAALLSDDGVVMVPDYPVQEGKAACTRFVREVLPATLARFNRRIRYVSAEIAVLGDLAFDRGTFAFTTTPRSGGPPAHATGKYFWLLRRDQGTWKMARAIVSLDEEDPSEPPTVPAGEAQATES